MLENLNLKRKLSHEEYKHALPALQRRLDVLQRACWQHGVPSVVVFEGWDAAGKGGAISALTERMDPRGFRLHPITASRSYEQLRPWLWRFWLRVPGRGEMALFDRSWYLRVLEERVEGVVEGKVWRQAYQDIVEFERMLAADHTVMVKCFLHISKKEQKHRFEAMERNPVERWRVTKEDWNRHKKYSKYLAAVEEMMELTESDFAPWTIVEATSKWYARRKIFDTLIAALEMRLGRHAPPREEADKQIAGDAELREAMESLGGDTA
jgi:polyphosphate kinase 2 (PPK2 family)